ncbi:MAG: efflux RND transporter permease subunit, partial [Gammaproteobacteria bacterium]|nr:efflux RND transporter permease subunit [Gammaproteobacteria bacterium]
MYSAIRWFARNGVAANLLMILIAALGLNAMFNRIPLEVFPEFELDIVRVTVPFRGATPAEVEEGVVIRVEEALFDLEGIKEMRSESNEGSGLITIEVDGEYDARELLSDVKNRVDAISTFPEEIERPVISLAQTRREVISIVVSGDLSEKELRRLGERVRDDIANLRGVTQVELAGVRPYEVAIEVSEDTLQKYGLTFERIASAINQASLDLSAGAIKTRGGEILIRSKGQAYIKEDFENIVVVKRNDGTRLTIGDLAEVKDGFEEEPLMATFNKQRAVVIEVYRTGDQSAIDVATAVKAYAATAASRMPPGVEMTVWRDRARIVKARLSTLTNSAIQGGILIFLLLTLFLRFSVAIWVCVGIPISFMGALALMPEFGVTINIISLFAFILVLGIVVDDAIVTGENIYNHLRREANATQASINGALEIATPVIFGVLTTVVAFIPLLMVEGQRGQIFAQIPKIVIPVLLFSLVESKLILPAHLKHLRVYGDQEQWHNPLVRLQRKVADGLEWAIDRLYKPVLAAALRQRYFTLSMFVGVAIVVLTLVFSGWIGFIFFPRVQSETARANLIMSTGTPFEITSSHIDRMTVAAERLRDQYVDPDSGESVIKNILATYGSLGTGDRGGESHLGRVMFEIVAPEERVLDVTSADLVGEWRRAIGPIPGAREITYRAEIGRGGDPLDVQLMGEDFDQLRAIAQAIKT